MRKLSQRLHAEADVFLVQAFRSGDVLAEVSDSYRLIIWQGSELESTKRNLMILPPATILVPPCVLGCKGYIVSIPEEFLLMFRFEDCYPFRIKSGLPRSNNTTIDLSNCSAGRTIERTVVSLNDQCQLLPKGHILLSGLLKILLVSVTRVFQNTDEDQVTCVDQQLFERFISLVGQHNVGKKGMQAYAKALSIKAEVLSEAVKRVSGYPASHHIYQHIIRTAKHAAIGSSSTMKEVAFGLGFKDVAHFSKFFRNKAGMTFSDYKKAYQLL